MRSTPRKQFRFGRSLFVKQRPASASAGVGFFCIRSLSVVVVAQTLWSLLRDVYAVLGLVIDQYNTVKLSTSRGN